MEEFKELVGLAIVVTAALVAFFVFSSGRRSGRSIKTLRRDQQGFVGVDQAPTVKERATILVPLRPGGRPHTRTKRGNFVRVNVVAFDGDHAVVRPMNQFGLVHGRQFRRPNVFLV